MKKILITFLVILSIQPSKAQQSFRDSIKDHFNKTYQNALKYNDINVAINSLQNIISESNSNEALLLKDTMAMLYFATKSYYSSLILSKEVYQLDPSNISALARSAECYQNLGEIKNAVTDYETVTPLLKNPYYYYQLAVCQYSLKRFSECEASIHKVMTDSNSNKIAVVFNMPNGNEQQVPVDAAALNMSAVLKMDNKYFAEAKIYLEKSLLIFPEFEGAKQNLKYCLENLKSPASTKPTPVIKPKTN